MYAKLFTSIYQGTLRGNSHGLLVFTNLLAHCDKHGEVDMHPKAIAEEVGLSVSDVRVTLAMLESPDDESRSPDCEGRRIVRLDEHRDWGWRVVNYLKYRAIRDEDDRREQNRQAQERWRARQREAAEEQSTDVSQHKPASSVVEGDKPIQKQIQKQKQNTTTTEVVTVGEGGAGGTPAPARKRAGLPSCPEEVDLQVWSDWLALRKAKRAPVTETVVASAVDEARKAGMPLEAFIRVWCARGSQGLQADWLKPHERGGNGNGAEPPWLKEQRDRVAEFAGPAAMRRPGVTTAKVVKLEEVINVNAKLLG